jgi:glycosyltransferase involved in cell wall biosynthesis
MRLVLSCGSPNWGGLELMAQLLAGGLQDRGHRVVVFCRPGAPLEERLAGTVECEPILGGADLHPRTVARCARALRRHRPDVVICNTVKDPRWTGVAARLLRIPVVYRQEIDEPYRKGWYHRLVYGWVPARTVVNSDASRRTALASAPWLSPEEVEVVPNGIDLRALDGALPLRLELPDDALRFCFVGRWEARKGVRELAEAWPAVAAALPNAWLVVGGWGPLEGELRGWLEGAPRVRWLGFVPDVPALLKAVDVVVAPSHYEGFGLVVAEAMAVGVPVVSTSASSIPELLDDGVEGLLVPPRDAAALARAMISLGGDPELRRRMGSAGRQRARRDFGLETMLDRHEELLGRVAAGAQPKPAALRPS